MKILHVRVGYELFQKVRLRDCPLNDDLHQLPFGAQMLQHDTDYVIMAIHHNKLGQYNDGHPISVELQGLPGMHWVDRFSPS